MKFYSIILLITLPLQAFANRLPEEITTLIDKAIQTEESYIINLVANDLSTQHKKLANDIKSYIKNKTQPNDKVETAQPAPKNLKQNKFSGNIEAGLLYARGNSDSDNFNTNAHLAYETPKWTNTLNIRASNRSENGSRSNEEYRANNQFKLKISQPEYLFFTLEYVNDRFSGTLHRISETFGYGRYIINNPTISLSSEVSLGARQSRFENSEEENSILGGFGTDFIWNINEKVRFSQNIDISTSQEATITQSETALRTQLVNNIYSRFLFEVEHLSNVPEGRQNTDTTLSVNLGYGF